MWLVSVASQGEPATDAIALAEHTNVNSTMHVIARFDLANIVRAPVLNPAG